MLTPATTPVQRPADARLLEIDGGGMLRHHLRAALPDLLRAGDLLIANDAATLPASLHGVHRRSGAPIEVRLAGRPTLAVDAVRDFSAVVFGAGDHRSRTEDRPPPPELRPDDVLQFGPIEEATAAGASVIRPGSGDGRSPHARRLTARVRWALGHPRLVALRFDGTPDAIWAGLARHGKPVQYAHVPEPLALWDSWTRIAALPVAFEPPSAGFLLDWAMLDTLRERGIGFATLTHAAGLSSTGDAALDARLPLAEPYHLGAAVVQAIARTRAAGGRIVALGTTVTRALEHAASLGPLRAGEALADNRLGPGSVLRVADGLVSGTHERGSSHHALLHAFAAAATLDRMDEALARCGYRGHEYGDSVLLWRTAAASAAVGRAHRPARVRQADPA